MTDWERVERERNRGRSWSEIAEDRRVAFAPPPGSDPGRALKAVYFQRRARADRGGKDRKGETFASGPSSGRRLTRRTLAVGVVALLIASVVVYLVVFAPSSPGTNIVTYCGGEGSASHYHPLLVIDVDGTQQPLPYDRSQSADIGFIDSPGYTNPSLYCPSTAIGPGIHALHTHDGSGIIHAELPPNVAGTPTLGNFFEIWGEPLSHSAVWTYSGSVTATVLDSDTHQTTDYSSNPASIPLYAPAAGPTANPYAIPQSLIFNGQYGEGSSGGTYSGEIIWLNVTSGPRPAMENVGCNCLLAPCSRSSRETVRFKSTAGVLAVQSTNAGARSNMRSTPLYPSGPAVLVSSLRPALDLPHPGDPARLSGEAVRLLGTRDRTLTP